MIPLIGLSPNSDSEALRPLSKGNPREEEGKSIPFINLKAFHYKIALHKEERNQDSLLILALSDDIIT